MQRWRVKPLLCFLTECSSKSQECTFILRPPRKPSSVLLGGATGLLWKRILIPHLFHHLHTLKLNHLWETAAWWKSPGPRERDFLCFQKNACICKQKACIGDGTILVFEYFWLGRLLLYICRVVVIVFSSLNHSTATTSASQTAAAAIETCFYFPPLHVELVTNSTGTLSCIFSKFILRFDLKGWKFKGTAAEWLLESSTMYNQHQWGLHTKNHPRPSLRFERFLKNPISLWLCCLHSYKSEK